jgi:hypothetical protein
MLRKVLVFWTFLSLVTTFAAAAGNAQATAKLSAAEIAARNVAARGGAQGWRSVQALKMSGKIDAGGNNRSTLAVPGRAESRSTPPPRAAEEARLPFVMELKRPHKMRVELAFNGQTALQVFDGAQGYKLRPFLNRRDVEPYTQSELKASAMQFELDGPLVEYEARGTTIELAGMEKIEGHETYKLKVTMKSGESRVLWIDADTFLETKIEGTPRRLDGRDHPVEVYFRDYRAVSGLKIPYVLETKVLNAKPIAGPVRSITASEKMVIDKVEVNPNLSDVLFTKADLDAAASGRAIAVASRK